MRFIFLGVLSCAVLHAMEDASLYLMNSRQSRGLASPTLMQPLLGSNASSGRSGRYRIIVTKAPVAGDISIEASQSMGYREVPEDAGRRAYDEKKDQFFQKTTLTDEEIDQYVQELIASPWCGNERDRIIATGKAKKLLNKVLFDQARHTLSNLLLRFCAWEEGPGFSGKYVLDTVNSPLDEQDGAEDEQ